MMRSTPGTMGFAADVGGDVHDAGIGFRTVAHDPLRVTGDVTERLEGVP